MIFVLLSSLSLTLRTTHVHEFNRAEKNLGTYAILWENETDPRIKDTYFKIIEEWAKHYGHYRRVSVPLTHILIFSLACTVSSCLLLFLIYFIIDNKRILTAFKIVLSTIIVIFSLCAVWSCFVEYRTISQSTTAKEADVNISINTIIPALANYLEQLPFSPFNTKFDYDSYTKDLKSKYPEINAILRQQIKDD